MADLWGSIKQGLNAVAPLLANAIIPGSGGVAGSLVASILGVQNTPESINAAVANLTPEQIAALKTAEMTHQEKLLQIGNDNDQMYLADVQDARKRQIESEKATGKKDLNLYVLAWTVVISFFITVAILFFVPLPQGQANIVYMLLGTLGTGFATVLGYFFGSSKSSADKTQLLAGK